MDRNIVQAAHRLHALGHRRHRLGTCITCMLCDHSQKMFCAECGLGGDAKPWKPLFTGVHANCSREWCEVAGFDRRFHSGEAPMV